MNAFDVAQTFLDDCRRDAAMVQRVAGFEAALISLGFRHFACWSHVDPLRPPPDAVVLHNYPRDWIRRYSEAHLYAIDPVSQWASRTLVPFHWDDTSFCSALTPAQRSVLAQASCHGIEHGFTVPIHAPHGGTIRPGSCSAIPATAQLPREHFSAVQLMVPALFEAARAAHIWPMRMLSERERECLILAAEGKSDWVAGRILGISERTVHAHIESAKRRLRVTTRVQAIVQALATRQILLDEVLQRGPAATRRGTAGTRFTLTAAPEPIGSVREKRDLRDASGLARDRRA